MTDSPVSTHTKRIIKNIFFLGTKEIAQLTSVLAITIIAARVFGPSEYGRLVFALSIASFASFAINLGLSYLFIREGSRSKNFLTQYTASALALQFASAFGIILSVILVGIAFPQLQKEYIVVLLATLAMSFSIPGIFLRQLFQTIDRTDIEAKITLAERAVFLVASLIAIALFRSVESLLILGYILSALVGLFLTFPLVKKYFGIQWFVFSKNRMSWILRQSWPMAFSLILLSFYSDLDSIMLRLMKGAEQVGLYGAQYRIVFAFHPLASLFVASLYPVLSQLFVQNRNLFEQFLQRGIHLMWSLGIFAGTIVTLFASPLIGWLYGPAYLSGMTTLQILIWSIAIGFMEGLLHYTLILIKEQRLALYGIGIGTFVNILLNFLLIPKLDIEGAAIATVVAVLCRYIFFSFSLRRSIPSFSLITKPIRPLIGILIIVILFYLGSPFVPPLLLLILLAFVYFAFLIVAKDIPKDIIVLLKTSVIQLLNKT